jgi:DNA (cytosine-5)-methyltransferase 1
MQYPHLRAVVRTRLTGSDWFCGAGGSTEGARHAGLEIVGAANHSKLAVDTHNTNHPQVDHYLGDLLNADPRYYPHTDFLLASPECTNHSLAKGKKRKGASQLDMFDNKPPDPDEVRSRATMETVPKFAAYHKYNCIIVENVVDIRWWEKWDWWLGEMDKLGYEWQICYFNAMFFHPINGCHNDVPQSRDRIYIVFTKKGNKRPNLDFRPWGFCPKCMEDKRCIQSWKNPLVKWGRYRRQYVYRCPACTEVVEPYYFAAWNAIDWSLPCPRIGDRKKPLKPKTTKGIQIGLKKYGNQSLLIYPNLRRDDRARALVDVMTCQTTQLHPALVVQTLYGDEARGNLARDMGQPLPTQTTRQSLGLVVDLGHTKSNDEGHVRPASAPMPTQTTAQTLAFIVPMRGEPEYLNKAITDPLPTQITVGAPYLVELHGSSNAKPIDGPLGCVLTNNHHGLVMPPSSLVSVNYFDDIMRSVDQPFPTQTTSNKLGLLTPQPFILEYYTRDNAQHSVADSISTLSTQPRHYLVSYYNGSDLSRGMDEPVPTITTKARHAMAEVPTDEIDIDDLGFRMLQPHEIKDAMGFSPEYVLLGTTRQKVWLAGNANPPPTEEWIVARCIETFE